MPAKQITDKQQMSTGQIKQLTDMPSMGEKICKYKFYLDFFLDLGGLFCNFAWKRANMWGAKLQWQHQQIMQTTDKCRYTL